jgi:hypothetical protein
MSDDTEWPQEVPMSVKMQRVLDRIKRMSREEHHQLLVRAGLMTEAEAQEALARPAPAKKPRRKPKKRPSTPAKNGSKPPTP